MSDTKKDATDTETILMALDQVSQTIDVMTSVVGRLRTYIHEKEAGGQAETTQSTSSSRVQANRTLH